MNKKYLTITIICITISVILGTISKDIIIGGATLATGVLCTYFATERKRINYILGLINYLLMGVVAWKNNLYGIFFFYIFVFSVLQILGFIMWNKNLEKDKKIKVKEFTLKNSIIITTCCILGSLLLGCLLSLIPHQRLAFMDATSNCINLCGVILMILRFKEAWWVWLINNIIDLSIWAITFVYHGENALMMLLVSIGYFLINIYGILKWNIESKKGKK